MTKRSIKAITSYNQSGIKSTAELEREFSHVNPHVHVTANASKKGTKNVHIICIVVCEARATRGAASIQFPTAVVCYVS